MEAGFNALTNYTNNLRQKGKEILQRLEKKERSAW